MESYVWKSIGIIGVLGAIFMLAALLLRGRIGVKTTLLWLLGGVGAIAVIILLKTYWNDIASFANASMPSIPAAVWWAILGVLGAAIIGYVLYKIIPATQTWLPTRQTFLRAASLACGIAYIYYAISAHEKLGRAVFAAWFFSIENIAIGLSIIGAILISWLWSPDGTRKIPWRKIVAMIIACFIAYMLTDFFFPGFMESLPELWYEGNILSFVLVFGLPILIAILLFLCLFKGTRVGAATVLGFLLAIWVLFTLLDTSRRGLSQAKAAERPAKLEVRYLVSSEQMSRIPWPDDRYYNVREIDFGPSGRRPTALTCWVQEEKPNKGDLYYEVDVSEPLRVKESREPLWVIADSDGPTSWELTMLYWHE